MRAFRRSFAVLTTLAVLTSLVVATSAGADEDTQTPAHLAFDVSETDPASGGALRLDSVEGFASGSGSVIIDEGTDSEEFVSYQAVSPGTNELIDIERTNPESHPAGTVVEPIAQEPEAQSDPDPSPSDPDPTGGPAEPETSSSPSHDGSHDQTQASTEETSSSDDNYSDVSPDGIQGSTESPAEAYALPTFTFTGNLHLSSGICWSSPLGCGHPIGNKNYSLQSTTCYGTDPLGLQAANCDFEMSGVLTRSMVTNTGPYCDAYQGIDGSGSITIGDRTWQINGIHILYGSYASFAWAQITPGSTSFYLEFNLASEGCYLGGETDFTVQGTATGQANGSLEVPIPGSDDATTIIFEPPTESYPDSDCRTVTFSALNTFGSGVTGNPQFSVSSSSTNFLPPRPEASGWLDSAGQGTFSYCPLTTSIEEVTFTAVVQQALGVGVRVWNLPGACGLDPDCELPIPEVPCYLLSDCDPIQTFCEGLDSCLEGVDGNIDLKNPLAASIDSDEEDPEAGVPPLTTIGVRPPQASISRYMQTVSHNRNYEMGCNMGKAVNNGNKPQDAIVILHYFDPENLGNGVYGATLNGAGPYSTTTIRRAAQQFARGYYVCNTTNGQLRLALGTNNHGSDLSRAHGQAWGRMVVQANEVGTEKGWAAQVLFWGAIDIEMDWSSPTAARAWVDGYNSVNPLSYVNYGDAAGCPPAGTCNNGWTQHDVYYVSWKVATAHPLPQIYNTNGTQAEQWQQIDLHASNHDNNTMEFAGALTQWRACNYTGGCSGIDNTPSEGWRQLYEELSSEPKTMQDPMRWLTDISWKN